MLRSLVGQADNLLPLCSQRATSPPMCRYLLLLQSQCRKQSPAVGLHAPTQQTTRNRDCLNRQPDIPGGLSNEIRMCRPITASNLLPESQSCTSPSTHSMLPNTSALARRFSTSSALASKSSEVTRPLRPTIRAANSDTSPTPQPISRTCIPAEIPARRKRCSVNGFKIEACRANRRCSRSSWPSRYAVLGHTETVYHRKGCIAQHLTKGLTNESASSARAHWTLDVLAIIAYGELGSGTVVKTVREAVAEAGFRVAKPVETSRKTPISASLVSAIARTDCIIAGVTG